MNSTAVVKQVLSQRVVGYNFTPTYAESVTASVCLMSDGSQETQYTGYRMDKQSRMETIWEYGTQSPRVEREAQA